MLALAVNNTMPLAPTDLEVRRTPKELRAFVEHVRTSVRGDRTEFESGMAKRGHYKEFLDEVEPLCNFAEAAYPPDFKVQPVLGNQGYDAVVFDARGKEVDRIEFAKPYDGATAAASARQVVSRGHSDVQVCDHTEVLEDLIPFFEATSKAKSLKDYDGVTLVFTLAAPRALPSVEASFERQLARIISIIAAHEFKAKRVVLYVPPGRLIPIDGKPFAPADVLRPIDLVGSKLNFRICQPRFDVDISLTHDVSGKEFKKTITLTEDESAALSRLSNDVERQAYVNGLAEAQTALQQLAVEAGLATE